MPDFGMEVSGGCSNDDDLAATPRRSKRRIEREARGPGRRAGGEEERAGEVSLERMGFGGRKKRVSGGAGGSLGVVRGTSGSYVTSVRTHHRGDSDRGMDTSDTIDTIDTGVFVTLEDIASQEQQQESRRRRSSDGSNESSTVMVPTGKTSHIVSDIHGPRGI